MVDDKMAVTLWEIYKKKFGAVTDGKSMVEAEAPTYLDKMLDAAKDQISTLTTLLTGGYFALISIGDIKDLKAIIDTLHGVVKLVAIFIMATPMIFWVASLAYANVLYLSSIKVDDGSNYEDVMQDYLNSSLKLMLLGLLALIVILCCYIAVPTPPQPVK
jgi:hypothetical protein